MEVAILIGVGLSLVLLGFTVYFTATLVTHKTKEEEKQNENEKQMKAGMDSLPYWQKRRVAARVMMTEAEEHLGRLLKLKEEQDELETAKEKK